MSNIQAQIDALNVSVNTLNSSLTSITGNSLSNYNQLSRLVSQQGNVYNALFFGNANINTSNINLTGNLRITGNLISNNANIVGNANINGNLGVVGNIIGTSNLIISGFQRVSGNANISGNLGISGNLFTQSNVIMAGSGSATPLVFVDYINGRVGVNSSNPQHTLDVNGTANINGTLIQNGRYPLVSNTAGLRMDYGLRSVGAVSSGTITFNFTFSTNPIVFLQVNDSVNTPIRTVNILTNQTQWATTSALSASGNIAYLAIGT